MLRRQLLTTVLLASLAAPVGAQQSSSGDWPFYGGDSGSTKSSALDQINRSNVGRLRVAWRAASPDNSILAESSSLVAATLKATPLALDGTLFLRTNLSQVVALDGRLGAEIWRFNPRSYETGRPPNYGFNSRGVAFWSGVGGRGRILLGTGDAHLWSLDAHTGRPDPGFGSGGRIDLLDGLRRDVSRSEYSSLSPPIVVGDVIVVGSAISDGPRYRSAPPGDVRGFDAKTGALLWTFHTVPLPGEAGNGTWEDGSWSYSGATNAWTLLSADQERGIVYVPLGTPTNDWFGGHRLGDNLFAESLVALDASTGQRRWHFQFVHHGVWDYDLPAAPNLVDLTVEGVTRPLVAQVTKQGFVFLFDRVTGIPVFPIEERPVPASTIPGEVLSPTQPVPVRPPPFERQGVTIDDLIDFTPELRTEAETILERVDHGPIYTPPSERGTLNLPGWLGGADWEGAAVDPQRAVLYVPSRTQPIRVQLIRPDPDRSDFDFMRGGSGSLAGPEGLPLVKPPWARMTAIDLAAGSILWQVPLGDGPRSRLIEMGIEDPGPLGGGSYTGPLLLPDLLVIGHVGSRGGRDEPNAGALLFLDPETGDLLYEIPLPAAPTGTPMTYLSEGRQFIALSYGQGPESGVLGLTVD